MSQVIIHSTKKYPLQHGTSTTTQCPQTLKWYRDDIKYELFFFDTRKKLLLHLFLLLNSLGH